MIPVLLVDDETTLLEMEQLFLEQTGSFTADTCQSGTQAFDILSRKRYDVIVSDNEMPGMNGIQLLRELKSRGDPTPVIIFTGQGHREVVMDALNTGAVCYLRKGSNPEARFSELAYRCRLAVQQRRSEIALKENGEQYRALFGQVPVGVMVLDLQGTILLANNAAITMTGAKSSASFTGRNVMEFIAPESRGAAVKDLAKLEQGHDSWVAEYEAVTVPGARCRLECTGVAIRYEGKPAVLVSLHAVTRREEPAALRENAMDQNGQQAEKKGLPGDAMMFRTLTEHAEYGVFILEGDCLCYANPYFTAITGYTPEELQDRVVWDLIHPEIRADFKEKVMDRQKSGTCTTAHYEVTVIAKTGAACQVRVGITPVEFGEKPAVLGTVQNVTDQRMAESRLKQANKKLHLLNEVTHHDLLNNFTALHGYFEMIKFTTTDTNILEFLKKQEVILSAIREQIDFTMYYQKIGNQKPRWQHVGKTIRAACANLPLEQVVMKIDVNDTEIHADPLLVRVFYNLIENALRHGEHVTEIRYSREKRPDGLAILYEDNGIGISARTRERIVGRGSGKNAGLGLFLIREILAATRCTIRESGEPGKGARFEIIVPAGSYRSGHS